MRIFNSLGSNYNLKYVLKSLFSNTIGQNQKLKIFLEDKYQGKVILTYKGREALTLTLKILNLPKESCVAINGFTCYAVHKAVEKASLVPICLDLGEKNTDLNFAPETLEKILKENKNVKVVVVQNTLGYSTDIEKLVKICRDKKIILVEDLAHCVLAKYRNGIETGSVGDFVVLSFSQDKVVDAVSGGALVIRNKKYLSFRNFQFKEPTNQMRDRMYPLFTYKIRSLYDLGLGKILHFTLKKLNLLSKPMQEGLYNFYSLPNWYCNLAVLEFDNLPKQISHRREIAEIYAKNLNKKVLNLNIVGKISISSNLRFPIFVENRKKLIQFLKESNIFISDIWYDDVAPECPNAVEISRIILNLPTHINITERDALKISERINEWLRLK